MEKELIINLEENDISLQIGEEISKSLEIEQTEKVGAENDYNKLKNKPKINEVELVDEVSLTELGFSELTNTELENLLKEEF